MKKNQGRLKSCIYFLLVCISLSCNENKKSTTTTDDQDTSANKIDTTTSKMNDSANVIRPMTERDNCIIITRAQILTWLTGTGWDDPSEANYVPYFVFEPSKTDVSVMGYPVDRTEVPQTGRQIPFKIRGQIDPPCEFPSGVVKNPNKYYYIEEKFVNAQNELIPFTFLRLRPRAYSADNSFMSFDVEIVTNKGGGELVRGMGESKPSPPAVYSKKIK